MALATNLVAHWKLDEASGNAADATGNGNTLTNNNTVGYAAGKLGNCADFGTANTNKSLSIASNLGITGGNITISAWVKMRTEISSGRQMLSPVVGGGTNNVEYHIRYDYNAGTRKVSFVRDKNGSGEQQLDYTITLGTSNWYHVAMTYDGTNIRGYINGTLVGTTAASGNGGTTLAAGTRIGTWLDGSTYAASIYQDEVDVWSRALSDDEILQVNNSNRANAYPLTDTPSLYGAKAAWNFDESSGNAADSTGNGFTLTNNGSIAYASGLVGNAANLGANPSSKYFSGTLPNIAIGTGKAYSLLLTVKMLASPTSRRRFVDWRTADSHLFLDYTYVSSQAKLLLGTNGTSDALYTVDLGTTSWHQLLVTVDASNTATLYLDGAAVVTNTRDNSATGSNFYIGAVVELNSSQSPGCIVDNSVAFARCLTSTEASTLWSSGSGNQYPFFTTTTKTETGLARITAATTKTETGVARVTAKTIKTESGVANIKNNTLRTESGVARIQNTVSVVTQQQKSPTTVINDSSIGTVAWQYPDNAKASDDIYSITSTTGSQAYSNLLKATGFNFSVPDGAKINGIKVEIERIGSLLATVYDNIVSIVKSDGTVGSVNLASATRWDNAIFGPNQSNTYYAYGGPSSLWGENWTPADINSSNFGAVLSIRQDATYSTAAVDHIRITVYYKGPNNIDGVARISKSVSQTISGKSRIQRVVTATETGISRIIKVVAHTITGVASIIAYVTRTQTITGLARVTVSVARTITGHARITAATLKTETGKADILKSAQQAEQGTSRIRVTVLNTIQGIARLQQTVLKTIQGISRIALITARTINGVARVTASTARNIPGVARVTATTVRTAQGLARITVTTARTIPGVARIQRTFSATTAGIARVTNAVAQAIAGKARITATAARTVLGLSRITATTQRVATGKARLQTTVQKTETGKSRVTMTRQRTETGLARVRTTVAQTETGRGRILQTVGEAIQGLARITVTVLHAITGRSRIEISTAQNESGIGSVAQPATRDISGVAMIISNIRSGRESIILTAKSPTITLGQNNPDNVVLDSKKSTPLVLK